MSQPSPTRGRDALSRPRHRSSPSGAQKGNPGRWRPHPCPCRPEVASTCAVRVSGVADSPEGDAGARGGPAPVPGADPAAVGAWLAEELGDERWRESTLHPIGAGRSNLTYRVVCPAGAVV